MSYEDTCSCPSSQEDGDLSYEEEDTCHMRRRIHVMLPIESRGW
jgi:hypothetical protein